jgi:hypothetical protein
MKLARILANTAALILITVASLHALEFTSICSNDPSNPYCENVGKFAYNMYGQKKLQEIRLGKIIGVAWKLKGAMIGYSEPMPSAGLPGHPYLSPRNAFYYIIEKDGHTFLVQCREIRPED